MIFYNLHDGRVSTTLNKHERLNSVELSWRDCGAHDSQKLSLEMGYLLVHSYERQIE